MDLHPITKRPRALLAATYWYAATVVADDAAMRDAVDQRRRVVVGYILSARYAAERACI